VGALDRDLKLPFSQLKSTITQVVLQGIEAGSRRARRRPTLAADVSAEGGDTSIVQER